MLACIQWCIAFELWNKAFNEVALVPIYCYTIWRSPRRLGDHPMLALISDELNDPKEDSWKIAILFADLPPLPALHVCEQ